MGFSPFFFGANKIMLNKRADKLELLRIAEAVALEKSIDKELIIDSMETGNVIHNDESQRPHFEWLHIYDDTNK